MLAVPAALVAGVVLEREWPGNFGYGLAGSGPRIVTWIAFGGAAAGIVVGGLFLRRVSIRERHVVGAIAAVLFVLPVTVHGFRHWSPLVGRDPQALSPVLIQELRAVPAQAVVIASPEISYRIAAYAPVYLVCAPPVHVANTRANEPYVRVKQCERWLAGREPGVASEYGATWAVRKGHLYRLAG
jgi:hypothetical protein